MEEITNTTAAESGAQTTNAGAAAPAFDGTTEGMEQQNKFQQFLAGLFSGEKGETEHEGKKEPEKQDAPKSKTYSEAELQAVLSAKQSEWEAAQQEKAKLENLSPEDRLKAESDAREKQVSELEAKLRQRDLKDAALTELNKDGFPAQLADLLDYSSEERMKKSLESVQKTFQAALGVAVKEKLRGKTPEGLGGAARAENTMRDEIARNIRGGLI